MVGALCLLLTPALAAAGTIEGTVTDEATSEPIDGVTVCGFVIGTDINSCDDTNAAGGYAVTGLPTNSSYKVEFNGESGPGYETEYYDDKSSWIKANPVAVTAGAVTAGIDAQLTPIPSEPGAQGEDPAASPAGSVNPLTTPAGPFLTVQPPLRKQFVCRNGKRKRLIKGQRLCVRKKGIHRPNAR